MTPVHLYVDRSIWRAVKPYVAGFRRRRPSPPALIVGAARGFCFDPRSEPSLSAERLLDRHWIVNLRGDRRMRLVLQRAMFDTIAGRYDVEVDVARNGANAGTLLSLVGATPGQRVLDFGCGPGTVHESVSAVEVVGCDVSPAMRERARAHVSHVVDPAGLQSLRDSVDGMIAAYVLHLAVPDGDLVAAAKCVRQGGRVAANFHKGNRLNAVSELLKEIGFVEDVAARRDDPRHGPIRVWERVR